jgi:hypothetical protein
LNLKKIIFASPFIFLFTIFLLSNNLFAHGLHPSITGEVPLISIIKHFVISGFQAFWKLEHLLFVLGFYLISQSMKQAGKQIVSFTLAHSISMAIAIVVSVSLPVKLIDLILALSIIVIALENIFCKSMPPWRTQVIFIFGLIHGLKFAVPVIEHGIPKGRLISGILSHNAGIEIGQIIILLVAILLTFKFMNKSFYNRYFSKGCSLIILGFTLKWAAEQLFLAG